jgi:hypothetical protein
MTERVDLNTVCTEITETQGGLIEQKFHAKKRKSGRRLPLWINQGFFPRDILPEITGKGKTNRLVS